MNYEIIYITHLPSFYKNNIFNEIAKTKKILVIFIGKHSLVRKLDFISGELNFEYIFLSQHEFEKVKKLRTIKLLLTTLKQLSFKKIVVGGWDMPHFWTALIFSKLFKNNIKTATIIESSIIESNLSFLKLYMKKIFLMFNDYAIIPGGGSHKDLITKINPKKEIFIANGVGIPNIFYSHINKNEYAPKYNEFLYIGRIAKEKNIDLLIKAFCTNSHFKLNIIGGKLSKKYKNIKSLDYMDNRNLPQIIQNHIALILPSQSETWGLVVEESLLCGVGVIISSNVGCGSDLVSKYKSGIIFENNNLEELQKALIILSTNYNNFSKNALLIDFKSRYRDMQKAYCLER